MIVATDDRRIFDAVKSFGGNVVDDARRSSDGTDRVAEVAEKLDAGIIVNVQGDEPMIEPASLDLLAGLLENDREATMATLAAPILSAEQWRDPNCVKVVCDKKGRALYFSRSPIPYVRDGEPDFESGRFLQHLGLYAYRREFLLGLAKLPPAPLEEIEKLEQLRVLAAGERIRSAWCRTRIGASTRRPIIGVSSKPKGSERRPLGLDRKSLRSDRRQRAELFERREERLAD